VVVDLTSGIPAVQMAAIHLPGGVPASVGSALLLGRRLVAVHLVMECQGSRCQDFSSTRTLAYGSDGICLLRWQTHLITEVHSLRVLLVVDQLPCGCSIPTTLIRETD
jgi:hypothetical protein